MRTWTKALTELKNTMTAATFQTWLADTAGHISNDTLTITTHSGFAADWLKHRCLSQIQRAVNRVAGRPLEIKFRIKSASDHPVNIQLVTFDPTIRGFVQISTYAIQFWQPYIGHKAFTLWIALKSYAWYAQRAAWPSVTTLGHICFRGNRQQVTGRWSQGRRYYGALEHLEHHKIVYYRRHFDVYTFYILDHLPLLTPEQVEQLSAHMQTRHESYLKRCEIDFEDWKQLEFPTLTDLKEV